MSSMPLDRWARHERTQLPPRALRRDLATGLKRFVGTLAVASCTWLAVACHETPARAEPVVAPTIARGSGVTAAPAGASPEPLSAAAGIACFKEAYPEHVCSTEPNAVVLCDGTRLSYDDGRTKTHAERLERPDLQDMLAQPYDLADAPPGPDVEPGRVRSEAFFDAVYGATPARVGAQLTHIAWMPSLSGRKLQVSKINGVDRRLQAVSNALERLPAAIRKQAAAVAGTYNHREIRGTDRKSAHSYAIAIDVAPSLGDYWRWREPGVDPPRRYRNRMPLEIVRAFEAEGFIWGGRWNRYDTMHFEYRPELLIAACRRSARPTRGPQLAAASPTEGRAAERYAWLPAAAARRPADGRLSGRIAPPAGYRRVAVTAGSFGEWLRELPLVAAGEPVRLYDGSNKSLQNVHVAIVDLDVGKRDLQQCADAVMRLRAEYLFASGRGDEVCFRAVSGDAMPYLSYRRGLRPPQGRAAPWRPAAAVDPSHAGFRSYLDRVFGIANTASLLRELEPLPDPGGLAAGDVYIEAASGGRFGHAVLVLDVAENAAGERVFLIGQSYMPAQQFHVLINTGDRALSPWYRAPSDGSLRTPEWTFPPRALRRFAESCQRQSG